MCVFAGFLATAFNGVDVVTSIGNGAPRRCSDDGCRITSVLRRHLLHDTRIGVVVTLEQLVKVGCRPYPGDARPL